MNALERRFPTLGLPRLDLGRFPTPVEETALASQGASLWVKREDLSGAIYGGNKVRKLEYLLQAPAARGQAVLSFGAQGSNHLLATAVYGRQLGLAVHAVIAPQPSTPHVDANEAALLPRLDEHLRVSSRPLIPLGALRLLARLRKLGRPAPMTIAAGGSNAIGSVGWVSGGLEIAEQVARGELPEPDQIWLALGSMGNAAGLLVGLRLAGLRSELMAVRVVERPLTTLTATLAIAHRTLSVLRHYGLQSPSGTRLRGLRVVNDFVGPGYGHDTPEGRRAMEIGQRQLGLKLEGTYTAKALAGCLAQLEAGAAGRHVLFMNTVNSKPLTGLPPASSS